MALNGQRPTPYPSALQDGAAETALMERVRTSDASALDELLSIYWPRLVAYVARIVKCDDTAQDVAQEVFIRVWNRRTNWSPTGSVRSYLYSIARNLALNERRRRRTRADWAEREAARENNNGGATPHQLAEAGELRNAAERAIASLPERRREVFTLARFDGLSYAQIAETMGISPQTVANQMSAALGELRRALAPLLEEAETAEQSSPK